ncbi:MAG: phosphatase PAP2 family protein [Gammaproteobacteria bacterium]|nr:phosphatase PAP2 family protein [Gammaproteobacteria bacterium]MBU1415333.1 phosphatase PAP2 family protein [Gammaproteobacteria bacterium]
MKSALSWHRINEADLALCLRLNQLSHVNTWRHIFRVVSRLGNGVFWYSLMLVLPIAYGQAAWPTVVRMVVVGLVGLAIYKWLKHRTSRPRPCEVYSAISAAAPVLDRFSFPSGHTLHATSLAIVSAAGFPELAPIVYSFAIAVALSRPILGLHYPSDVLAGAAIGALIADVAIVW